MRWTERVEIIPLLKEITVWVPLDDGTVEGPVAVIAARDFVMEVSGEGGAEDFTDEIQTLGWNRNRDSTPQYLLFPWDNEPWFYADDLAFSEEEARQTAAQKKESNERRQAAVEELLTE